ncbi:hypothetical protein [Azospirillum melinis]
MGDMLLRQSRMLANFYRQSKMPEIYLVNGRDISNFTTPKSKEISVNNFKFDFSIEQIALISHFTLDLAIDELYPDLIGKGYDHKYNSIKRQGAPKILVEIYRIFSSLRNAIMHDSSSIMRTDNNFIEISREFKGSETEIVIKTKQTFELSLYVSYRISESIARFGMEFFDDIYYNLFLASIYNHILDYIYIKDRYGMTTKIDIPINISWYQRLWVTRDAHELVNFDGKILDSVRPIKQTIHPFTEQYDYVFEKNSTLYVIPNEFLLQGYRDSAPIPLTRVFLETFPVYSNKTLPTIEYEE